MACNGEYSVVITTCADRELARRLADHLVRGRLAACVQLFPIESIYTWKGEVCDGNEVLLLIKTRSVLYEKLVSAIRKNHSYDIPEIIKLPITGGLPEYLKWIDASVLDA